MPYCFLHICAIEQMMLSHSRRSRNINNIIHATCTSNMSSEKEAALGLPQLGDKLLADTNSGNVNGKPQNCEIDAQEY